MMKRSAFGAAAILLAASPAPAEEGLFTTRLLGGVSTVHPDLPNLGGTMALGSTLGLTDALAVTFDAGWVAHRAYSTAGFGTGLRLDGKLGEWTRPFVALGPQLVLVWGGPGAQSVRPDLGLHGALGIDYLFMWGLGFTLELGGTLPVGFSGLPFAAAASVTLGAGFFMEF